MKWISGHPTGQPINPINIRVIELPLGTNIAGQY